MVKDRLNALQVLASSNGNKYVTEDPDLLAAVGTEKELVRRQFFAEVEEIRERIEKLQANVEEVKLKHSAILTAWNINEEMNNELEDFQADMKETFNKTIEMLKHMEQSIEIEVERQSNKIGADSSNLNRPKNKSANLRMRITQHAALWHKFVEVMTEYNSAQADYRDRCENWKLRQLAITHQNVSEQELKTLLEQNNPSLFTNGIIMETQQARETLADLEARYAHVMQLETSIRELHDMFIDMAMLTETQGEMVNRIEFHVNNSVENIEDGLDDVEDAVNIVYSNRRKSRKIIPDGRGNNALTRQSVIGKLRPWLSSSSEQKLQTFQLQDAWMPNIKPGRHSVLNHLYVYDKLVASAGSELGMEIKTY